MESTYLSDLVEQYKRYVMMRQMGQTNVDFKIDRGWGSDPMSSGFVQYPDFKHAIDTTLVPQGERPQNLADLIAISRGGLTRKI